MMRSLYSGISGLKVHQTKMDVIGNNISNVNTVGFRASTVNFTDVFYQTTQNASGPNANTGAAGTNAVQIGLGANVASIAVDLSGTGATQRTDRGMDIMINGDAFLIVESNGNTYFTKSGALDIDANGTLYCTTNGANVLGWGVDANGDIRKDAASSLNLMGGENAYSDPNATTDVTLSGNVDSKDTLLTYSADGAGYPIAVSFYDNVGNLYSAKLNLMKSNENTESDFSVRVSDILGPDGKSILSRWDDASSTYVSTNQAFAFGGVEIGADAYTVNPTTGEITITGITEWPQLSFNTKTGAFETVTAVGDTASEDAVNKKLNFSIVNATSDDGSDGLLKSFPDSGVDIDFSDLTNYASNGASSVKPTRGSSDGTGAGNMAGTLNGFSIQTDGKIYGVYSNGDKKLMGQIAVATFANPSGLESVGKSMFAATLNSGDFDGIGIDISEVGSFSIGALEMSDVDLSTEFTNMITTQRGFQANSRVITTSDTMLEELVNLKR
ncbi:MAG: flagellar hook-basal body complex protein [Eubacterium sp.]|nr:flagellar hook-basal body complex protein [Eubacterium sp.]